MKYLKFSLLILLSIFCLATYFDCTVLEFTNIVYTVGGSLAIGVPFVMGNEGESFLGSPNLELGTCHAYAVKKDGVNLVGTVSTTLGSPNITGTSTTFLTDFESGDWIFITGILKPLQIKTITSNTALVLHNNVSSTVATATYQSVKVIFQGGFDKLSLKFGNKKTELKESQGGDNASDKVITGYMCDVEFGASRSTLVRLSSNLQGFKLIRDTVTGLIKGAVFTYAGGERDSDNFVKLILVKIISGVESTNPMDTFIIPKCNANVEGEFTFDATSQRFTKTMFTGYKDEDTLFEGKPVIAYMGELT